MGSASEPAAAKDAAIEDWPFRRILTLALVAIIVGHAFDLVSGRSGGARQIVLALSGIKWAGLFVLAYSTLRLRRGLRWLAGVVAIEIVLGMSGFFGDFRLVLFVLFGAAMAAHRTADVPAQLSALVVGAVLTLGSGGVLVSSEKGLSRFPEPGHGCAGGPPAARRATWPISPTKRPSSTASNLRMALKRFLRG